MVIDGRLGFRGGINIGDEYTGASDAFPNWRDTHLELAGPIVNSLQLSFSRDWYFGSEDLPKLNWDSHSSNADQCAIVLATGPDDTIESCGLAFAHCIATAQKRVWIASPYFIPDDRVLAALQLAAMRGADVRIMMPRTSDSVLFKFAPYSYFHELVCTGAKIFLYEKGFAHQKVMLIDDKYAVIGSANMDFRSFFLNFEISAVIRDKAVCADTAAMLENDFAHAVQLTSDDLEKRSWWEQLATRITRLAAPIL